MILKRFFYTLLNGNRISKPDRIPSSAYWEKLGEKLYDVLMKYFETN